MKCTVIDWKWMMPLGICIIHGGGMIWCNMCRMHAVTTRRVGKDSCALRTSCRSGSSAKDRQWFEREISWGIYIAQLLIDQWPRRSWIAQHYSLRVLAGGHTSGGSMLTWYLVWSDCTDEEVLWCLSDSSFFCFTATEGSRAWFFRLVNGWLFETDLLLHYDVRILLWQLLVLLQRCKLHCTTAKVLLLYGKWHDLFFIHVSSACFQSGLYHDHVKSFASETVEVAMVH